MFSHKHIVSRKIHQQFTFTYNLSNGTRRNWNSGIRSPELNFWQERLFQTDILEVTNDDIWYKKHSFKWNTCPFMNCIVTNNEKHPKTSNLQNKQRHAPVLSLLTYRAKRSIYYFLFLPISMLSHSQHRLALVAPTTLLIGSQSLGPTNCSTVSERRLELGAGKLIGACKTIESQILEYFQTVQ